MPAPKWMTNAARCALGIALAIAATLACAQTYPTKPIHLVVPFPPGGAVDILGRLFGEAIAKDFGQPVIVENRPGAGAAVGAEYVAKAPADGYTLLIGTSSTHGVNSAVNPDLPYHPIKDFSPVVLLATTPWMVVVNPSLPVNSVADLIAYAKANPGKLNFASYGRGSSNHLATELLKARAHIDVTHVPYKGSAPALVDLIAGQVQFMLDTYSTSAPHIKAGRIRVIGVTSAQPVSFAPGAQPVAQTIPGYETGAFFAIFAPAGTSTAVVERLNRAFNGALADGEIKARLAKLSMEPAGGAPEVLARRVADEVRTWADLVKEQHLKFEN